MSSKTVVLTVVLALIVGRWVAQVLLEWLNRRHARAHSSAVPDALKATVDEPTYFKTVSYTLARG
ncbi:MAG: hypothetical protein ACREIC_19570, partial [Limisphaerales bacterium]